MNGLIRAMEHHEFKLYLQPKFSLADLTVIGDTTAMSTPHEIDYTLTFDSASLEPAS